MCVDELKRSIFPSTGPCCLSRLIVSLGYGLIRHDAVTISFGYMSEVSIYDALIYLNSSNSHVMLSYEAIPVNH